MTQLYQFLCGALFSAAVVTALYFAIPLEMNRQHKQCLQYQADGYEVECK